MPHCRQADAGWREHSPRILRVVACNGLAQNLCKSVATT
jgi:hypothetical protein